MSCESYTLWVLVLCLTTLATHITCQLPPDFGGSQKNSWPKYKGLDVSKVAALLREDPRNHVFVQRPDSYSTRPRPSEPVDLSKDIWLYPNENDVVVIIPKRGTEHHSPVSGWVELVGAPWEEAKDTILEEIIGVQIVYGVDGFIRDQGYNINRIFLDVSENGTVARAPRLG